MSDRVHDDFVDFLRKRRPDEADESNPLQRVATALGRPGWDTWSVDKVFAILTADQRTFVLLDYSRMEPITEHHRRRSQATLAERTEVLRAALLLL